MQSLLAKTLLLILFTPLVAWGQSPTDEAQATSQLRVLCYNIHHGEGVDRKLDLKRIAELISSLDPDIVALQEIDKKTSRTEKVDQAAELAKLTKMNFVFGGNIQFGGGDYGNALLSPHKIKSSKNHALPLFDDGEQRGVLEVELKIANLKQPLRFLATHLDHRRPDRERIASAKMINQLIEKQKEGLSFLAGDMNDVIGSETLKTLDKQWTRANQKPVPTVPVDKPTRQIDFILSRKGDAAKAIEFQVLDEAIASDHRAVFAVFEITN